jgi:nitrogen fixation/metabolism regulation signal transduction histidine kinase
MITKILWWIWQIILVMAACFFLVFGIQMLIASYSLNDPFTFIMTFFSSSLIILISGTLLFTFIYKMVARRKKDEGNQ